MNNLVFNETASQLKTTIYGTDASGNAVPILVNSDNQIAVTGTVNIGDALITVIGGTINSIVGGTIDNIGTIGNIIGGTIDNIGTISNIVGGTIDNIGTINTILGGTINLGAPVTIGANTFTSMIQTIPLTAAASNTTVTFDVSTTNLNNFYVYSNLTGATDSISTGLFISPTTADGYLVDDPRTGTITLNSTTKDGLFVESVLARMAVVSVSAAAGLSGESVVTVYYTGQV